MATLIKSDKTKTVVQPKNGKTFSLKELQEYVKGYIELLPLGEQTMVLNEEGRIYKLPFNAMASMIAGISIVGDVVICDRKEIE